jgi:hypothetical protein
MPHGRDCGGGENAVPLHPETFINFLKGYKVMKTMNQMRMREYCSCCNMMMAMTMMKEGIYIIGINKNKKKQYEKDSINNSSIIQYQHQQYLG